MVTYYGWRYWESSENMNHVPCCDKCIYANEYIPAWGFPYINPRCSLTHKLIEPDDVCCEFFDDGKSKPHRCKICGMNISDMSDDVEFCEYCR